MEVPEDTDIDDRKMLKAPGFPSMAFIEHKLAGDPTNWWVPNGPAIKAMLRSCGFEVIENPDHETYLARKKSLPSNQETWNKSEFLSAIGRDWEDEINIKTQK